MYPRRFDSYVYQTQRWVVVHPSFFREEGISMKNQMEMTTGSIAPKLLLFAVSLACTGILQQLFNAADVMVVGRFVGSEAMAAVGSNGAFIGLLVNLFIGVSLGANVVIARATGRKDEETIKAGVHNAILIAIIGGFLLLAIGELLARPLLGILGVPSNIFPLALLYLRIYFIGMPVILLYNFESAIFRSQGNTKTPLIVLILSGCTNVVLNLVFVVGFGRSVDGVAIATVTSNVMSSTILFWILKKTEGPTQIDWQAFHFDGPILKEIFRIGLPAGLQSCVFSISNLIIQSAINSLGATVMAASSAAFNLEIIAYYVINAFGQGCTTFTSQNYGARQPERCVKVARWSMILAWIAAGLCTLVLCGLSSLLLSLFTTDPQVIHYGVIRLWYIAGFECINAILEVISGCMRGYGYSFVPAIITLVSICGVRVTWTYTIFQIHHSFAILMLSYPVSWGVTAIALILAYFYFKKHILPKEWAR